MKLSLRLRKSARYCRKHGATIWFLALVLLLLNDHVLKYSGQVPSWLTGKLSDFAGLVVAPALAALVFRARSQFARCFAFSAVAVVFSAIKLSADAAHYMERLMHWRIWSDPTDLVALASLVPAWWITEAMQEDAASESIWSRLKLVLAAWACVATSELPPGETLEVTAFLENGDTEPIDVTVYRVHGPIDCAAALSDPETLQSVAYWLHFIDGAGVLPLGVPGTQNGRAAWPPCDAVVIHASGLQPTLVWWGDLSPIEVFTGDESSLDMHYARGVHLYRVDTGLYLSAGSDLRSAPFTGKLLH